MVENFIVIQLIFAEKFVSQDFTVRSAPGLIGPANTCVRAFCMISVCKQILFLMWQTNFVKHKKII